ARRRPSVRARGEGRSRDPADGPPRQDDDGEEVDQGDGRRRPRGHGRDGEVDQGEARRVQGVDPRAEALRRGRGAGAGVIPDVAVERVEASAYTIPTDGPESDGTLEWDSTTLVLVELMAGDETGLGYTYGNQSIAALISSKLAD